jgi:hypothetical protein
MMRCSNKTDMGPRAGFAARFRALPFLLFILVLLWGASATAQTAPQCLAQGVESPEPTSVVWGSADEASGFSVVWGNDSVDENFLVWEPSVVWGADGSEGFDTIWVDTVAWGIEEDNSACSVLDGDNQFD